MIGNKPDGNDFNFVCGGYKCAVGINLDSADGGLAYIQLVKERVIGGGDDQSENWEGLVFLPVNENDDADIAFDLFITEANRELGELISGVVPVVPTETFPRLLWICKNGITFNPDTNTISKGL